MTTSPRHNFLLPPFSGEHQVPSGRAQAGQQYQDPVGPAHAGATAAHGIQKTLSMATRAHGVAEDMHKCHATTD